MTSMASCLKFTCSSCGFSIEGWDGGNPYIEYPKGVRKYYHHPRVRPAIWDVAREAFGIKIFNRKPTEAEMRQFYIEHTGNAPDYLCIDCGTISRIDGRKEKMVCNRCQSVRLHKTCNLAMVKCPKCNGLFSKGEMVAIS